MDIKLSIRNDLLDNTEKIRLEKYISDTFDNLQNYLNIQSSKDLQLIINIAKTGNEFRLSCILNISRVIYVFQSGEDLYKTVDQLYKSFKKRIIQQRRIERKEYLLKKKIRQKTRIVDILPDLTRHRKEEDQEAFSHIFQNSIQHIKKYLKRRLKEESSGTSTVPSQINETELLDELYLEIWSKFDKIPRDKNLASEWIFGIADRFIVRKLKQSGTKSISIEELARMESSDLEERMTVDAEGELYLEEDLLETGYKPSYYKYQDFFPDELLFDQYEIEDYNQFIEAFDNKVYSILSTIPIDKRTTFDLFFMEGMSIEEISRIKKTKDREVRRTINEIYDYLILELKKWLNKNYNLSP